MIVIKQKGDFKNTLKFFGDMKRMDIDAILSKYGEKGCAALEKATPKRTGLTSRSWHYVITRRDNAIHLEWRNSNVQDGKNIAILIQYGFVTPTGYRVAPRDYINPALETIYDQIVKEVEGKVRQDERN